MCDYSLHHVSSRPAKVSDKLVTTELARSSTRGFAAVGEHGAKLVVHDGPPQVAVCLLPGTELAFDDDVRYDRAFSLFGKARVNHKVARFRQIDMNDPHVQHDALEFPNGQVLKVGSWSLAKPLRCCNYRSRHSTTSMLKLDALPASDSRVALNRANGVDPDAEPGRCDVVAGLPQHGHRTLDRVGAVIPPFEGSQAACRCRDDRAKLQEGRAHGDAAEDARGAEAGQEDRGQGCCLVGR